MQRMRIYLVQHGASVSGDIDPLRPLSDEGRADVARLAAFLRRAGIRVARILHSGKLRAGQTAEILAEGMPAAESVEQVDGLSPNDAVEPFASRYFSEDRDLMLVGHLPFMGRMAAYLTSGDPDRTIVAFVPGSIACVERDAAGDWTLCWMIRPDVVPDGSES
jgi:phosphohistidine phosphatase